MARRSPRMRHGGRGAAGAVGRAGAFIVRTRPSSHLSLSPVLQWIEVRLHEEITLQQISDVAAVSARTLNRRFQEHSAPVRCSG